LIREWLRVEGLRKHGPMEFGEAHLFRGLLTRKSVIFILEDNRAQLIQKLVDEVL
jgi:hypothetical protein